MKKIKNKSRKSAVKRFKFTPSGKILHRSQGFRHLRGKKGKRNLRRLKQMGEVFGKYKRKLKKMLGK